MARTLAQIQTSIKDKIRTYPSLDSFLFPEDGGSQTSIFNLIIFTVAAVMFTFEVIADDTKNDIISLRNKAIVGSAAYVRQLMLDFQFGYTLTINTTDSTADDYFVPKYTTVDNAAKIVTQAAVTTTANGLVIKVAKGTAPSVGPLTAPELTALRDYYFGSSDTEGSGFAGIQTSIISLDADRMRVEANIYYYGQFVEATVKANVITAIDNFFATFTEDNFGGVVKMIELVDAIQEVDGVSRVELLNIDARANAIAFGSGVSVDIQGIYTTVAGYLVGEDTSGNTLNDTITMFQENS